MLPASVDLRPLWVKAKYPQPNQVDIGDCTSETAAFDVALMKIKQGTYVAPFSVAFHYAEERIDIGTFPEDSGANMVDEGNALAKHGICYESTMPTSGTSCDTRPSAAAVAEAANFKCDPNQKPIDWKDMQLAIFNCQQDPLLGSFRMGFPVAESFFDAATNGGWVPNPSINESLAGGHSMEGAYFAIVKGPNDKAPRLYVGFLQSWGNTGDMSSGISTYYFQYPEFFESAWVQMEGGTDNYQQPDLPRVSTPTITILPTTLKTGDSYTVSGVNFTPNSTVVWGAFDASENSCGRFGSEVYASGKFTSTQTMTCTSSGYVQASDSGGTASNKAPFTIGSAPPTGCWPKFLNCWMTSKDKIGCIISLIECVLGIKTVLIEQKEIRTLLESMMTSRKKRLE